MTKPGEMTRRTFLTATAVGSLTVLVRGQAPQFRVSQYHNQLADSPLHLRLVQMWDAIKKESSGRIEGKVFAHNNENPGSDPAVLKLLVDGEVEFFTLMGGIMGNVVPAANVQQMPFAFKTEAQAWKAMDGPLGAYIRQEMLAKGIVGFPVGAFDNGIRQMGTRTKAIKTPADLVGMKMRVPDGKVFDDMFKALGATPLTVNSADIYSALQKGTVDAQENPLGYMNSFKHYEVMKYISMTNHMWSGFNLMANGAAWKKFPADIQAIIERQAASAVKLERQDQQKLNVEARGAMAMHGIAFNEVDPAPFRAKLSGMYAEWKKILGTKCWTLLEAETGKLG